MTTRTLAQATEDLVRAAKSALADRIRADLAWGALHVEAGAKRNQRAAGLRTRTGAMIQRTRGTARWLGTGGKVDGEIVLNVDVPYANAHEHGATIRPVRSRYLAIPLGPAKTAAGVARGGPRSFTGLFPIRSKAGNLLLVRRKGTGIEPMFVLVNSVRIPRRPFAQPAIEATREALRGRLAASIRAVLGGG